MNLAKMSFETHSSIFRRIDKVNISVPRIYNIENNIASTVSSMYHLTRDLRFKICDIRTNFCVSIFILFLAQHDVFFEYK